MIPTCADLDRFCIGGRNSDDMFVLGYLGTVGSWYLFDETLRCFQSTARDRAERANADRQ